MFALFAVFAQRELIDLSSSGEFVVWCGFHVLCLAVFNCTFILCFGLLFHVEWLFCLCLCLFFAVFVLASTDIVRSGGLHLLLFILCLTSFLLLCS